mmetsp:Transcript_22735/g.53047  ORF Transcript_22735/g.53047 Transcript_22735/m.53047 type:complete len:384 (+) Transcript_22735:438-1589(+)
MRSVLKRRPCLLVESSSRRKPTWHSARLTRLRRSGARKRTSAGRPSFNTSRKLAESNSVALTRNKHGGWLMRRWLLQRLRRGRRRPLGVLGRSQSAAANARPVVERRKSGRRRPRRGSRLLNCERALRLTHGQRRLLVSNVPRERPVLAPNGPRQRHGDWKLSVRTRKRVESPLDTPTLLRVPRVRERPPQRLLLMLKLPLRRLRVKRLRPRALLLLRLPPRLLRKLPQTQRPPQWTPTVRVTRPSGRLPLLPWAVLPLPPLLSVRRHLRRLPVGVRVPPMPPGGPQWPWPKLPLPPRRALPRRRSARLRLNFCKRPRPLLQSCHSRLQGSLKLQALLVGRHLATRPLLLPRSPQPAAPPPVARIFVCAVLSPPPLPCVPCRS